MKQSSAVTPAQHGHRGRWALHSFWRGMPLPYVFILPVHILLILVLVIPMGWAAYLSLQDYMLGEPMRFVGLRNYAEALSDGRFWSALRTNILFVFFTVGIEVVLGMGIALLLARGFRLQKIWIALILAPYAVSPVVGAVTWKYMLTPHIGLINYVLSKVGIHDLNWVTDPNLAFLSVVLVESWRYTPFMAVVLYAAIVALPQDLFEAARVDGASKWATFRAITLPLIAPALVVGVLFRIIFSFRTFDVVWIMTQGGPVGSTELLSIYLYIYGFRYWDFGFASAVGWLMLAATAILASYYLRRAAREMFGSVSNVPK